jgi:P-type Cu+ transporter
LYFEIIRMAKIETKRIELLVEGMDCNNCALGITKQLGKMGMEEVNVNFATGEVVFNVAKEEQINQAVDKINSMGYKVAANLTSGEKKSDKRSFTIAKKFWFCFGFTLPLLAAMFIPFDFFHNPYFQLSLTIPVFAVGLWHFGRSGWMSLRAGVPNMDVLIILGSTAAFVYSFTGTIMHLGHNYMFYETTASIITLILLGNYLEHTAIKKTTSAIDELTRLQTLIAHKVVIDPEKGELIIEIESTKIRHNDILLLNSGDKVPVDGVLLEGHGSMDESMISGESIPVEKMNGDRLVGGTVVMDGSFKMKATAIGKETVLSGIIEMVKNAQRDKPQLQTLADKISAVFVPVVVGIALLTFAISFWFAGLGFQPSLMHSIAVLVIACPCALGLAIPTAVIVGVGRVAKNGILIKGASTIQKIVGVKNIVFDKTGTLTNGTFRIKKTETFGNDEKTVRSVLYSIEMHSSHPLAQSVVHELQGTELKELSDFNEIKGTGISAKDVEGNMWIAGSYRAAGHLANEMDYDLYLLKNDSIFAAFDLEDVLRPEAKETIDYLKAKGIKTFLLSGDRKKKCVDIANYLGMDEAFYEKLPDQKLEIIDQLSRQGGVAMVGDGINDAPALAKATVGISLSNATQVAIKSAQVILLNGKLSLIPRTWSISRLTLSVIKQNLFWAFFYNVIAIPFAAAGYLDPMIAAATMAFSDVIVVMNSLRLRSRKLD